MDFAKRFGTDKELEVEGVWVDIGEDALIKVARLGNTAYQKTFQRLMRPYRAQDRSNALPEEIRLRILIQALAETVLLDWKNFENEGKAIPYSMANAIQLMTDEPDFRAIVIELSNEQETFRKVEMEESAKNSPKRSSTS